MRRDSNSLGSSAPSRVVVADQSLVCCVGRGDLSLYIWTRACPPLFACLFRLDVIRRKETNSDLISITFCDDAAHFLTPLLPSSCVRGWYLFERKKVAKSSISLLNVSERTNERGSRHFAADSTGWLVVCVCRENGNFLQRGDLFIRSLTTGPPSLNCSVLSVRSLLKNGPFFPSAKLSIFFFFTWSAHAVIFFLLFWFLIDR